MNLLSKNIDNILKGGIFLLVFLFPTYLLRFSFLNIPTTLLEVVLYLIFLLWLYNIIFLKKENISIKEVFLKNKTLFIGMFLFVAGALVASFLSLDKKASFGLFKAYFFDPILFFIILTSSIKAKDIKNLLFVFLGSLAALALSSLFFLTKGSLTYDDRLEGIFNSPNFLAMSLAPAILIIIFEIFFNKQKRKQIFLWPAAFLLIAIPFFETRSYGAFFGVVTAFLWTVFLSKKTVMQKSIIFIIIMTVLFGCIYTQKDKLKYFLQDGRSSFVSRMMIWQTSHDILKENYIFGIGPGMFQTYYLKKEKDYKEPYLEWAVPYPHNLFLAFWIQNGLTGFLGFIFILYYIFKETILAIKRKVSETNLKVYILTSSFFIYLIAHGLFDTPYWKNDLSMVFFLFLGIFLILKKQPNL